MPAALRRKSAATSPALSSRAAKQEPARRAANNSAPAGRAGRRPRDGAAPELSRQAVVQFAAQLAQQEPLSEISIVRLAREMGVAPALIHYYVGSRDDLLSAVMNFAYRERMQAMPPLTGDWRADLEAVARVSHEMHVRWWGLAGYIATHNRFRLFQKVQPGETDWGLAFFDHLGRVFRQGGFTPEQAALGYHLLMLFLVSVGTASAHRQSPAEHAEFITGYVESAPAQDIPGAVFLAQPFSRLDVRTTFDNGLKLLLDGFAAWRAGQPLVAAKAARRPRAAAPARSPRA